MATNKKPAPARGAMKSDSKMPAKSKIVESGNKSGRTVGPKDLKKADKPNAVEKLVQDVTNRYRVTAREARDIVTAVSNVGRSAIATAQYPDKAGRKQVANSVKDLTKQVKETGKAAATGKSGTTAGKTNTTSYDKRLPEKISKNVVPSSVEFEKGKKRK